MDGSDFRDIENFFGCLAMSAYVAIPLALWKCVDICIWLYQNISISIGS